MFKAYLVIGQCTDFKIMHLTHSNTNTCSEKPSTDPNAKVPASPHHTTRAIGADQEGAPGWWCEGERGAVEEPKRRRGLESTGEMKLKITRFFIKVFRIDHLDSFLFDVEYLAMSLSPVLYAKEQRFCRFYLG